MSQLREFSRTRNVRRNRQEAGRREKRHRRANWTILVGRSARRLVLARSRRSADSFSRHGSRRDPFDVDVAERQVLLQQQGKGPEPHRRRSPQPPRAHRHAFAATIPENRSKKTFPRERAKFRWIFRILCNWSSNVGRLGTGLRRYFQPNDCQCGQRRQTET